MHYLHKVLVYIPDVDYEGKVSDDEIRKFAEEDTENYHGKAFDWRETDSAGRWSDMYPGNVIRAADDVDRFLKEIESARSNQKDTIKMYLNTLGEDFREIKIKELYEKDDPGEMNLFGLLFIVRILTGEYTCDSFFYDTSQGTAKICDHTIENIKAHPENWAMCFFDYHN